MRLMLRPGTVVSMLSVVTLGGCYGWPSSVDDSGLPPTQVGGYVASDSGLLSKDIKAPGGVIISVRASKDKLNGTILLAVGLLVPEGVSMRLSSPAVNLQSPEWPEDKQLIVDHIAGSRSRQLAPASALIGTADMPDNVYELWYFPLRETMEPQTALPQVRSLTVILPPLDINGRVFQAAPVTFENFRKCGLSGCQF